MEQIGQELEQHWPVFITFDVLLDHGLIRIGYSLNVAVRKVPYQVDYLKVNPLVKGCNYASCIDIGLWRIRWGNFNGKIVTVTNLMCNSEVLSPNDSVMTYNAGEKIVVTVALEIHRPDKLSSC
jgi:hypothetical protein